MALKHEERKCPYCPDRFHNGIGLANHVRGHLNRVGVSYNVRHFISAEEVKAIERRFSFQKKKKKGRASALLWEPTPLSMPGRHRAGQQSSKLTHPHSESYFSILKGEIGGLPS